MRERIVICAPVYNEEDGIDTFLRSVEEACSPYAEQYSFELLLVNDGSTDASVRRIAETSISIPIKLLNFSRNFGHPAACAALLDAADGDAVILLDADMQDDPQAIPLFLEKWKEGYDCVYAVRASREESFAYRLCFRTFYRILAWMSDIKLPLDSGNFSLIDKKMLPALRAFAKKNRYLPGMRAHAGFRQCGISVPRLARNNGDSKVGFKGLFRLALNGIFSFSFVPLRVFTVLGLLGLLFSGGMTLYAVATKFGGEAVPAWASQIITVAIFGSINILGLSVIGEYLARIYDIMNGSPAYVVDSVLQFPQN